MDRYCALETPIELIGQEALKRIARDGIQRLIRGLWISGDPLPACVDTWPVHVGDVDAGFVTSAVHSPDFTSDIGLATIDRDYWEPGRNVIVETPDGEGSATVTALPFAADVA